MPHTLYDTLRRMDPYVKLNDGASIQTVEEVLCSTDPDDPRQYVIYVDNVGRFMIYSVGPGGFIVRPPIFIEEKIHRHPTQSPVHFA